MSKKVAIVIVLGWVAACSSSTSDKTKTQADCDAIATQIRTAATQRSLDPNGVCSSTDPAVKKDFGASCQSLQDCNDHCCK